MAGDWMLMAHGFAYGLYDRQGGKRGDAEGFSTSMFMLMARRPLGAGTLGLRGMLSLDPAMGARGYPLLLQTGETANGRTPLIDRQHPHDLFMEFAATYSHPVGESASMFAYAGLPGEPALGPPAFMHRLSGMDNPEAPLGHHWLDSTHIAYGVGTVGAVWGDWKLEGSAFTGREPDKRRWNIERPSLDSYSARLSFNPAADWALQAGYGRLKNPEQLEPDVDVGRWTASVSANNRLGGARGQTTFAWGRSQKSPGPDTNAFLLESSLRLHERHTAFARAERVEKDELAARTFTVSKTSLGYTYDFLGRHHTQWGLGAVASLHFLPSALRPAYGSHPASLLLFLRLKLA